MARFGGGGAVGAARVEGNKWGGGCEPAGSGFRYLKSRLLQTTKFLPPYATELPTSPSCAPLRAISAAFLPVPAGGPRRRVFKAWPHRPSPPEAGESARLGGTGCSSQGQS